MDSNIYVINLDSSKDRLQYITNHINNEHNTTFTRFPGMYYKDLKIKKEIKKKFLSNNFRMIPKRIGTICCALAHMHLWNYIYETNQENPSDSEYAIILEDDAYLQADFRKKLGNLIDTITAKNNGVNNMEFFNLCTKRPHGIKISDEIAMAKDPNDIRRLRVYSDQFILPKQVNVSLSAYIIKISSIPKILNLIRTSGYNMNNNIDRLLPLLSNKFNMYVVGKGVVTTRKKFKSDRLGLNEEIKNQ
jgi:GR25 family glycosyltransferase involved in LPS biosynthesis